MYCENCGGKDGETEAQRQQRLLGHPVPEAGQFTYRVSATSRGYFCQTCKQMTTIFRHFNPVTGVWLPGQD